MANLSNINNKLLVGTNGEVRIGDTATVANVKLRVKQTAQQWTAQFVNTDSSVAYGISIDTSASSYGVAGTLQCYTNTGGGFIVRNDSKVGIGTTSPIAPLHVLTPAVGGIDLTNISRTANNLVRFTNPEYSTSATMGLLLRVFPDSDARQGAGLLMTGGSDNAASNLSLFVSKDDGTSSNISQSYSALHIAGNTGNVGIGTTSPDSKLDVKGASATPADGNQTLSITNTTGGTQLNIGTAENSYGWIEAREGATLRNLLLNPNGGNVGIGTTTPNTALQVNQSTTVPLLVHRPSNASFDPHGIGFSTRTDALNGGLGDVRSGIFSDYNGDLFLAAAQSSITTSPLSFSRLFIEGSNGNIGIGTISPAQPVHLLNGGFAYMRFTSQGYGATGFDIGQHTNGNIYLNNRDNTSMLFMTNNATAVTINNSQNAAFAGIITTETDGSVFGGSGGIPIYARSTGTVSYMQFQTSSTGSNGSSDGLTVGVNGSTAYIWNRENTTLHLGTNDTSALALDKF